jgi:NTE family protein
MRLGLALGGGGARGAAHVGVLIELERLDIRPHIVSGTSIGGLVAAMLAARLKPPEMLSFFEQLTPSHMYALPAGQPSLTSNVKIEKLLEETLGRITFADLELPLSLVTADLISRKQVILDDGDLISALLATIALPVLLPPVEREGLVLVDGGILNNLPFDVVRARGATSVVAVDLTNTAPYGTPVEPAPPVTGVLAKVLNMTRQRPTFQVMSTIADIISEQAFNARMAVSQPDLLLRPNLGTISLFDFHCWEKAVEAGKAAAREVELELSTFSKDTFSSGRSQDEVNRSP